MAQKFNLEGAVHIPAVLKTPFIEIHHLEGRTQAQREQLAKAISKAVSEIFKVQEEAVWIQFTEMKRDCFATAGKLWSAK